MIPRLRVLFAFGLIAFALLSAACQPEEIAAVRSAVASRSAIGAASGKLARIRACESGGNYRAVNSSGTFRGAYQFSRTTWNATARGTGYVGMDPAAAPPAVQDAMAARLLASSGAGQWPVCGRR